MHVNRALPLMALTWALTGWLFAPLAPHASGSDTALAEPTVCEQAQNLLGIPAQGEQLKAVLADLWASEPGLGRDGILQLRPGQVQRLIQVVHSGVRPNLVRDEFWSAYPASGFSSDPAQLQRLKRLVGGGGEYLAATQTLWKEASQWIETDPSRAQRLARTAVVLCFQRGDARISETTIQMLAEPQSRRLLGLSEAQHKSLSELAQRRGRGSDDNYDNLTRALADSIDELIAAPAGTKLARSQLNSALESFATIWQSSAERLQHRWVNAGYLWRLACLARADGDAEALTLVRRKLDQLDKDTYDPNSRRWLKEITTLPGGRPSPIGLGKVPTLGECKPPSP